MVAGRRIRFTAVLVAVVFALTGFSSGSHGGSSGHGKSDSGGGGCSSSKSKKKKKSDNDPKNSTATPSPARTVQSAHAVVVSCAGPGRKEAVLEVTSDVSTERTVDVPLVFQDASGSAVDRTSVRLTLKGRQALRATLPMVHPEKAAEVTTCVVGEIG